MAFAFDPTDGYRNTTSFPTKPANETVFRDSMQDLLDQLRDELNSGSSSAAGIANMSRQAIINGNMDVWQRGTSVSYSGNFGDGNAAGYGPDRWWGQVYAGSSGAATNSFTFQQQSFTVGQTDVPNEPRYFGRFNVSSVGTKGGGNAIIRIKQVVESVRTFAGQKCTVSFYAKADSARNCAISLVQSFGSGGSPSADVACGGTTISLTTAWQKFTYTFTVPSISGKTIGTSNDDGIILHIVPYKEDNSLIALPSGAVGTYAAGIFDIAQVQLCAGESALPFQPRSFGQELMLCQRYYETNIPYGTTPADGALTGDFFGLTAHAQNTTLVTTTSISFKVKKRVAPTVTLYRSNAGTAAGKWQYLIGGSGFADFGSTQTAFTGEDCFKLDLSHSSSVFTANNVYTVKGGYTADAEL